MCAGLSAAGYAPATELETRVLQSALIIHILENTPNEDMR